jgi:hypothetical protein
MEKKKLKEIEAKLQQLLLQADKSKKQEAAPSPNKIHVGGVIRRRRGHEDLHIV